MKDYEALSRKHFNAQAPVYDERDTVYYSREGKISCRDIAEQLKNVPYEKLLDVGCGTGYLIELLSGQRRAQFIGLDLSEEMIKAAKAKNIADADFMTGTANNLPFADNTFDIVTCSQSFHHYPYQEQAMQEAWRVLKKDGLYVLSDTGIGGIGAWIDNHILFKLMKSGDCHTQNKRGIEKRMSSAGFNIVSSRQISGMIYTVIGSKIGGLNETLLSIKT